MTDVSEPRKTKKKTRRASPASLPVFFIVAVIPFAAIGFGLVAAYAINSSVQRVQHAVLAEPNGRPWANVVVPPALQKNGDDEEPAADIEPAPNKEQAPVLAEPVLAAPPMGPMNPAPNVAAAHDGNPWATTPVRPGCERFGTMVDFDRNPSEAMLRAKKNRTLVMILHVSGNFEDDAFT